MQVKILRTWLTEIHMRSCQVAKLRDQVLLQENKQTNNHNFSKALHSSLEKVSGSRGHLPDLNGLAQPHQVPSLTLLTAEDPVSTQLGSVSPCPMDNVGVQSPITVSDFVSCIDFAGSLYPMLCPGWTPLFSYLILAYEVYPLLASAYTYNDLITTFLNPVV